MECEEFAGLRLGVFSQWVSVDFFTWGVLIDGNPQRRCGRFSAILQ